MLSKLRLKGCGIAAGLAAVLGAVVGVDMEWCTSTLRLGLVFVLLSVCVEEATDE